jgi:hypothetical protein
MSRGMLACAMCFLALYIQPLAAVAKTKHVAPAPELDVGLLSFVMVAAAAGLTYWRKRSS